MSLLANLSMKKDARAATPEIPHEIRDEVELFARESGRTATLYFVPVLIEHGVIIVGTWMARFSLRSNDKRLLIHKEGRHAQMPGEDVWFHKANPKEGRIIPGTHGRRETQWTPLDIVQMGASGVRQFLDQGNTWGRGEFSSLESALSETRDKNETARLKNKADAKYDSRMESREKRRTILGIPFLPVGIDLKGRRKKEKQT